MNLHIVIYYNQKHGSALDLKRGEKVYLLHRNIKIKRLSQKLDYQKIRLFVIIEKLGLVNYKLQLLKSMLKIYLVFHVSLLELALENTKITKNIEIKDNIE